MNETNGLTIADALALARGTDGDGLGNGNSLWWIIILALFFGWGGNGFGWGGNGGNACCTPATAQGVSDAFNFNQLDNGIRSTHDAVVDGFYQNNLAVTNLGTAFATGLAGVDKSNLQQFAALQQGNCQGFNGVNTNINAGVNALQSTLCNGFNGLQTSLANTNFNMQNCCCETRESIMQSNFANQGGFNSIVTALNTNACDIEKGQDDIKYIMAQNQNQTMVGIDRLGDRLIDYWNQKEMDELRTELQSAKFQISQAAQTEQLLNSLQPISRPAYITASPYQSLNYNGVNACGCGNF